MFKKLLSFSFILIVAALLLNVCYATDSLIDLNTVNNSIDTTNNVYDNTTYSSNSNI